MPNLTELVAYIAKALVDDPQSVEVREAAGQGRVIELQVAAEERGKIIGKKGRTAHAMRTLLNAASSSDQPVTLNIVD